MVVKNFSLEDTETILQANFGKPIKDYLKKAGRFTMVGLMYIVATIAFLIILQIYIQYL